MNKWDTINDLLQRIEPSGFHEFLNDDWPEELKSVCYAPQIGYHAWIFEYKGVPLCLWDSGNGWWRFHSAVSRLDVIRIKIDNYIERRKRKRGKEKD